MYKGNSSKINFLRNLIKTGARISPVLHQKVKCTKFGCEVRRAKLPLPSNARRPIEILSPDINFITVISSLLTALWCSATRRPAGLCPLGLLPNAGVTAPSALRPPWGLSPDKKQRKNTLWPAICLASFQIRQFP